MKVINQSTELVNVDRLKPHPQNPRRGDIDEIEDSIEENGFYGSLVAQVSTGYVLVGNHRFQAGVRKGAKKLPVTWVDVDDATALRILLVDNRTNDKATYDEGVLAALLESIIQESGSLAGTGYDNDALDDLLKSIADEADVRPEDDDVDVTPPENPKSKPGEIYQLGRHLLMCGDATIATDVLRLVDGRVIDVLWTDPPYGVSYVGKTRDALKIKNDGAATLPALLDGAFAAANNVMGQLARFYIAAPAGPQGTEFRLAIARAKWRFHQVLVWVKDAFVLGHSDYHYQHEDILYGWTIGSGRAGRGDHDGSRWYGSNGESTTLNVPRPKRSEEHPTMKPPELIRRCLENSAQRGDTVLDLFGGSGSTLIACEMLGMDCFVMELDPAYCDVIRRRYAAYAQQPELAP